MNNPMRFILTLVIVTACATPGVGQEVNTMPQSTHNERVQTSYDQVKEITTVRLNSLQVYGEPLASSQYVGAACATLEAGQEVNTVPQSALNEKVQTSYDQVKEITTVRLNPMQVYGEPLASTQYVGADEANFDASFTYSGRILRTHPKRILFSLTSTSQDWKYTDFPKLTALVDGKRLNLGPLEHVPSFTVSASLNTNSDDYISQGIAVSLSYKTFLRMANGKKVQIRMGPREFDLVGNHLEALRYLATRMVP